MDVQKAVQQGQAIDIRALQARHAAGTRNVAATPGVKDASFADLFAKKMDGLKFSAHAESRLVSRHIEMTPELMGKLEKAVAGAARKGARDSLIMTRQGAFIVNIPNRTVITAMDGESMKENIFTNIDSAVIAD